MSASCALVSFEAPPNDCMAPIMSHVRHENRRDVHFICLGKERRQACFFFIQRTLAERDVLCHIPALISHDCHASQFSEICRASQIREEVLCDHLQKTKMH